jgi:hypothetical protein
MEREGIDRILCIDTGFDAFSGLQRVVWQSDLPRSSLGLQLLHDLPHLFLSGVEGEGLLEELERSRGVLEPILGAREGVQERGLGSPERKRLLQKLRRAGEISPTEVCLSERRQDFVAVLDFGVDGLEQGHDSLVVPLLERESSQLLASPS